jgi:hypothetical protein
MSIEGCFYLKIVRKVIIEVMVEVMNFMANVYISEYIADDNLLLYLLLLRTD